MNYRIFTVSIGNHTVHDTVHELFSCTNLSHYLILLIWGYYWQKQVNFRVSTVSVGNHTVHDTVREQGYTFVRARFRARFLKYWYSYIN